MSEANYGMLGLEIVVVILGILIAFQIDRWAEERRDRTHEIRYLERLKSDLQIEIEQMEDSITYAGNRIAAVHLLEKLVANPDIASEHPVDVAQAVEKAAWRSFPQISAFVYTELQSTGHLSLLRSQELRRDLSEYYASIRHYSGVGFDLDIQHLYDRRTLGILSTAELIDIEEDSLDNLEMEVSPDRALEIAREFVSRQDAIDLLPNIAQHNVFNRKVIEASRNQAEQIVEKIDSLLDGSDL